MDRGRDNAHLSEAESEIMVPSGQASHHSLPLPIEAHLAHEKGPTRKLTGCMEYSFTSERTCSYWLTGSLVAPIRHAWVSVLLLERIIFAPCTSALQLDLQCNPFVLRS